MRLSEEKQKHTENIVMVVDEDATARTQLRKILSDSCRVIESLDPSMVVNTYLQYLPNAVIMDAQASMQDGRDIIKEILAHDPDAFVILTSSVATQQAILQSKERGAKAFLTKPLKPEAVLKYMSLVQSVKSAKTGLKMAVK